jgi:hypothetical protein
MQKSQTRRPVAQMAQRQSVVEQTSRLPGQPRRRSQRDSAQREAEHRSTAAASPETAGGAPAGTPSDDTLAAKLSPAREQVNHQKEPRPGPASVEQADRSPDPLPNEPGRNPVAPAARRQPAGAALNAALAPGQKPGEQSNQSREQLRKEPGRKSVTTTAADHPTPAESNEVATGGITPAAAAPNADLAPVERPPAPATLTELLREIAYTLRAFGQKRPRFQWAGGVEEIGGLPAVKGGREIWCGFGNRVISLVNQVELRVSETGDADLRRRALILMSDLHFRFDFLASGKELLVGNQPIDRDEFQGHRPEFERADHDLFRPLMQLSHEFAADARLKSGVNNGDAALIGAATENETAGHAGPVMGAGTVGQAANGKGELRSPIEGAAAPARKRPVGTGISKPEANIKARRYLREHPDATVRELACAIGCSPGLVCKLPMWQGVMDQRRKNQKPKQNRAVSLTPKLEAQIGETDLTLADLVAEQQKDDEPSPLDNAPRRGKVYRSR